MTVAICTWNRSALLRQTLASLAAARVPPGVDWEVLVVANQCGEDTADAVHEVTCEIPVRLVEEPTLGLSHARNAAVDRARGRYIAWIDDDVLVDPDWLAEYVGAIAERPDAAFFGGPIRPWFATEPPEWLAEALPSVGSALSLLDYGPAPLALGRERLPYGANFVIRAEDQRRHRYDPQLGRLGPELRSGEETAVILGVLDGGGRGVWVPGAGVRHYVDAHRQTHRYLRRYFFHNGATASLAGYPDTRRYFLGRPLWIWREAIEHELRYLLTRPFRSPAVWGSHLRLATTAWGRLYGMPNFRRQDGATTATPPG